MDKESKLRPFYLARILFEQTDEDHYLTTAQLLETLEKDYGIKSHRQTIPADIEILRTLGMDTREQYDEWRYMYPERSEGFIVDADIKNRKFLHGYDVLMGKSLDN